MGNDTKNKQPSVFCLMGPTASGKTPLAVELVQRYPFEIISVDSAMVYRGMDIGTAKPDAATLKIAPHRLIDIRDPAESYSAGQFCQDAHREIEAIIAQGKTPLLVGGTMLYFKALQQGLAALPTADAALRIELNVRGEEEGWPALHAVLREIDSVAAERINPNDSQRIQRALEVFYLSGKPISSWQNDNINLLAHYRVYNFSLAPSERAILHQRIALRFDQMLEQGFEQEVRQLFERGDLSPELPSIRSVGYRQMWDYLDGKSTFDDMREKAIAATRQLAKRQLTWLRSWPAVTPFVSDEADVLSKVCREIENRCVVV